MKEELKPIEKKSLHLKISDAIYNYVRKNGLKADDKLPSERDMAAMLNTSRHSVREALRILEDRGLIYVKTGSGAFIKNQYGEDSIFSFRLIGCSIKEIQELQSLLDHQAVTSAMNQATLAEKQELISIALEMTKLAKKNIYSHTLDHSFHNKLYQSAHNKAIQQLISQIRDSRFIMREDTKKANDSVWLNTVDHHLDLAMAIYEKDKEAAITAIDTINNYGFNLLNS